jgi:hypothetical protein
MASYSQLPGQLGLSLRGGDELGTVVDFTPTDLTGYTVTASVHSLVSGQSVAGITASIVDAAEGQVALSMSESDTAQIPAGSYGWRLEWVQPGDVKRTALTGIFEVSR